MASRSRASRAFTALVALAVVVTGLTLSPLQAPAARAATNATGSASILKAVNAERASTKLTKLAVNGYISNYIQEYTALVAKKGSTVGNPGTPKTALPAGAVADSTVLVAFSVRSSSTQAATVKKLASYFTSYQDGTPPTQAVVRTLLNFGSIGYVTKGDYTYAAMVLLQYNAYPTDLLVAVAPKITGTVKVARTLKMSVAFKPAADSYSIQWKANGVNIDGGTTIVLRPEHKGKKITVTVIGTKGGYTTPPAITSAATKPVTPGTLKAVAPEVSGDRRAGSTLSNFNRYWGVGGVTFSYQWLRNGKSISSATKDHYTLTSKDKGKKIDIKVTGRLAGYTTRSVKTATKHKVAR